MKTKNSQFVELFEFQKIFQEYLGNEVPTDDPEMLAHHMLGLVVELGEIAQADKRWKHNGRNRHYDKQNKKEEIADAFIFLINICLYSDVDANEIYEEIKKKIHLNISRYLDGGTHDSNN